MLNKELVESHTEYINISIFNADAMKTKHHLGEILFGNDTIGDFIYLTNRDQRYSYLYDSLEEIDVHNNCTLQFGYTSLFICKKVKYFENEDADFIKIESRTDTIEENDLIVFQSPFYKLYQFGCDDIIAKFKNSEKAFSFCSEMQKQFPALLARVEHILYWH